MPAKIFRIIFLMIANLFAAGFMVSCAQGPTKVYQTSPVQKAEDKVTGELTDIVITEDTVIVDARPAFEYSLAHLSGAIGIRPEDFNQKEKAFLGHLDKDLYFHSRRLARLGISPDTPVVVVGRGVMGAGEEGRVAWTLEYMGVKNVRFTSIDYFKLPLVTAESEPRKPETIWKPQEDPSLLVGRKAFLKASMKPTENTVIIDARPTAEYLNKVKSEHVKSAPDIGAINIPWTEFFDAKGMTNPKIKEKLQSVGITPEKTIYVIGNQGIESAAATMALRELGYQKAANFAGGYLELITMGKR